MPDGLSCDETENTTKFLVPYLFLVIGGSWTLISHVLPSPVNGITWENQRQVIRNLDQN